MSTVDYKKLILPMSRESSLGLLRKSSFEEEEPVEFISFDLNVNTYLEVIKKIENDYYKDTECPIYSDVDDEKKIINSFKYLKNLDKYLKLYYEVKTRDEKNIEKFMKKIEKSLKKLLILADLCYIMSNTLSHLSLVYKFLDKIKKDLIKESHSERKSKDGKKKSIKKKSIKKKSIKKKSIK